MLKEHKGLGVSFDLPDFLTVDQLDAYQAALQAAIAQHSNGKSPGVINITDARYFAIVYGTAVESGLISNWRCERQPEVSPAMVGGADARVIIWTGRAVRDYVREITEIPPA